MVTGVLLTAGLVSTVAGLVALAVPGLGAVGIAMIACGVGAIGLGVAVKALDMVIEVGESIRPRFK